MFSYLKKPAYQLANYFLKSDFLQKEFRYAFNDAFTHSNHKITQSIQYTSEIEYLQAPLYNTEYLKKTIFITARFRSGSTFLWNLFRHIEQCTAYYEPLNETKWFIKSEHSKIDDSHLGVKNYGQEYTGLEYLDTYFQPSWNSSNLYMDNESYDPKLQYYINELINSAKRVPVLQFNRMDFRLPWLKAHYPEAKILHLYRHPRQQWMSVQHKYEAIPANYPYKGNENLFLFYTHIWANDLKKYFPFLEPKLAKHPYALHYYLWRLSYLFGKKYADYSFSYENLVNNFEEQLQSILEHIDITSVNTRKLNNLNQGTIKESWKDYAPEDWFAEIEQECEQTLALFFKTSV